MHFIGLTALTVVVLAVAALLLGVRPSWFFALLSLACLLQSFSEAYEEHRVRALGCLIAAAFLAGASFYSLFTPPHSRGVDS
ncbi:hypothetical protein ABZT17_26850 [Streptomyces sp. NPDC005648]|uniref:hypothetical protein n=1 Tax=Streptomyces sp. NPDC005648 TaxID=3157044 RepID=UPI0033BF24F3